MRIFIWLINLLKIILFGKPYYNDDYHNTPFNLSKFFELLNPPRLGICLFWGLFCYRAFAMLLFDDFLFWAIVKSWWFPPEPISNNLLVHWWHWTRCIFCLFTGISAFWYCWILNSLLERIMGILFKGIPLSFILALFIAFLFALIK
jgi:hypothetical protein